MSILLCICLCTTLLVANSEVPNDNRPTSSEVPYHNEAKKRETEQESNNVHYRKELSTAFADSDSRMCFLSNELLTENGNLTDMSCRCSKHKGKIHIDCSNRDLKAIPRGLPEDTAELVLSNNNISRIKQHDFTNLTHLEILELRNISLKYIHNSAFYSLTRLQQLDISMNPDYHMTNFTVNPKLFQNLQSLETLKMHGNTQYLMKGTYPDEALGMLTSLQELWMDGMQNRTFGSGFRNLTKLTIVRLSGGYVNQDNVIRYCSTNILKGMLDSLRHVEQLELRSCYITYIDKDAFSETINLKYLDLSHNKKLEFSGINSSFTSLAKTKLEVLKLNKIYDRMYKNCGVFISQDDIRGIGELKYLKEIHLERNWITGIDQSVPKHFPRNLELINSRNNEFRLGIYMLYVREFPSVKKLDLSYQFFANLLWNDEYFHNERSTMTQSETDYHVTGKTDADALVATISDPQPPVYTNDFNRFMREADSTEGEVEHDKYHQELPGTVSDHIYGNTYLPRHEHTETKDNLVSSLTISGPVCTRLPSNILQFVTPSLPPTLEVLDISNSKLAHPIFRFNVSSNNSLKVANLSSCMLHCWDGPVLGLHGLEYLDLRNNFCTMVRASFFDTFPKLRTLIVSFNLLNVIVQTDSEGRLFRNLGHLRKLYFAFNRLENIPRKFLNSQSKITHLDFNCNLLTSFNIHVDHMSSLKKLNLSNNSISTFEDDLRQSFMKISTEAKPLHIDLSHNKIRCVCSNLDFLKWLSESRRHHITILVSSCTFENESGTFDISSEYSLNEAIGKLEKLCTSYFALAASLMSIVVLILNSIIGMIIYRYRWKIRYWYYIARKTRVPKDAELQPLLTMSVSGRYTLVVGTYKYHAYIAYAESDREFALNTLYTDLKQENLRLCASDEDFIPGHNIYSMIGNAIHHSRVTIFIVSRKSILDSEWKIAMEFAKEESLRREKTCFFAIFVEDIPGNIVIQKRWEDVLRIIRTEGFITYRSGADVDERRVFWGDCLQRINGD